MEKLPRSVLMKHGVLDDCWVTGKCGELGIFQFTSLRQNHSVSDFLGLCQRVTIPHDQCQNGFDQWYWWWTFILNLVYSDKIWQKLDNFLSGIIVSGQLFSFVIVKIIVVYQLTIVKDIDTIVLYKHKPFCDTKSLYTLSKLTRNTTL